VICREAFPNVFSLSGRQGNGAKHIENFNQKFHCFSNLAQPLPLSLLAPTRLGWPENIHRNASNNDKLVRRVVYSRVLLLSETETEFKTTER
jgi:hypothetical protein